MTIERERVEATLRRSFTKAQRMQVYTAQKGLCEACGKPLPPDFQIDHRLDLWLGGAHELRNWRGLCARPCHSDKTAAMASTRAHIKRLIANEKPETRKRSPKPIQSHGFDKRLTKGMDGRVRPRKGA